MRRLLLGCLALALVITAVWRSRSDGDAVAPARTTIVAGTLRAPDGDAVLGHVELLAFDERSPEPVAIASALALDGSYRVTLDGVEVRPGRYFAVRARAAGHAIAGRQLELVAGATHTADLVLARDPGRLELTARSHTGAPIGDAEVVISFAPWSGDRGALIMTSGTTDDHGHFTLAGLPPVAGAIHWSVRKQGRGRVFSQRSKPKGNAPVVIEATLEAGHILEVTTRDGDGRVVPGVMLELDEVDGPWSGTGISDERGVFAIADVPRGVAIAYRPRSNHALAGGYDELSFHSSSDGDQTLRVTVQTARRIAGKVRDAAGDPIEGVTVNAQAADRDMGSPRRTRTNADGSFELVGLREDVAWDLDARHADYAPGFVEHVAGGASDVEIALSRGGGLRGRIVDGSARAFDGLEIYVHRVERSAVSTLGLAELATTTTAADGTWQIERLNPGSYRVEYRSGARMQWQQVAAKVERAEVELELVRDLGSVAIARGASLDGIVDPGITSLDVAILPRGQGGAPHALLAQVRDGRFTLAGLAAGSYDVTLHDAALGYSEQRHVELVDGARTRATFAFAGVANVTGRVLDAAGTPIARAEVDVFSPGGGTQATHPLPVRAPDNLTGNRAFTGDDGGYLVRGLTPGRYRVRVTTPEAGIVAGELEVATSTTRDWTLPRPASLDIELPAASSVVLVDSAANAATPIATSGVTDAHGKTRVDNLPAGTYRVRAVAPGLPETTVSLAAGETRHITIGGTP